VVSRIRASASRRRIVIGMCAALWFCPAVSEAADKIGVIANVQGTAKATGADNAERTLKVGDDIFEGDVIRTDDNSNAQIFFLDKSALTLTPGSEVKMDSFIYTPGSPQNTLSIEEAKGAFRFIGGALSKENHVEIKTPVSTIGIRGGIEETHITPEGENADAIFIYGHDMTVQDKQGRKVTLTQYGNGAKVRKGGAGPVKMSAQSVARQFKHFSKINSAPARIHHPHATGKPGARAQNGTHAVDKGRGAERRKASGEERQQHRKERASRWQQHASDIHQKRKAEWQKHLNKGGQQRRMPDEHKRLRKNQNNAK